MYVNIESLDHKGRGITKIDNKITFVTNALAFEDVDIIITKTKKKYNEAKVSRYNKISKDRIEPLCPYYLLCGGCNIAHMSYQEQLKFKQNKIANIINKYLDKNIEINDIIYSKQYNYRNKLTLQVNNEIGLYKQETNDIINIDKCLISDKCINDKIKYLNNLDLKKIKQFILRISDEEIMLIIVGNKDLDITPIFKYFDNIVIKDDKYYLKKGNDYILKRINNLYYKISLDSFFQVNYDIMIKLYDYIKKNCQNSLNVLDLYCGTGSISIYISDVVKKVNGIEINENAIEDANYNKKINKVENINFICSDTKDIKLNEYYDTIIVDPPRSGLNKSIIKEILKVKPQKIIYVSCDPMTLTRDLKDLKNVYDIDSITPFDMFPNTYHVECVTILNLE